MSNSTIYPEIDLTEYRKEAKLKDGTKVLLRPMVAADKHALHEFFKAVPDEDARYLRDEVSSVLLIEKWADELDYAKTLPVLAVREDRIIGDATINRRPSGWKRHLGTVRIFVHEDYRNVGLGQLMIDELTSIAYRVGLEKLLVEIPDHDTSAISAFTRAGYERVARIPNMVKDRENMPVDIVVMIKDIGPALDAADVYDFCSRIGEGTPCHELEICFYPDTTTAFSQQGLAGMTPHPDCLPMRRNRHRYRQPIP